MIITAWVTEILHCIRSLWSGLKTLLEFWVFVAKDLTLFTKPTNM